jgi:hypothetical protein
MAAPAILCSRGLAPSPDRRGSGGGDQEVLTAGGAQAVGPAGEVALGEQGTGYVTASLVMYMVTPVETTTGGLSPRPAGSIAWGGSEVDREPAATVSP